MPINNPNPKTLKERVDAVEQTLLAINCFSNLCTAISHSNGGEMPQSDVAFLLEYLSDDSLFKVEALRMQIDALGAAS